MLKSTNPRLTRLAAGLSTEAKLLTYIFDIHSFCHHLWANHEWESKGGSDVSHTLGECVGSLIGGEDGSRRLVTYRIKETFIHVVPSRGRSQTLACFMNSIEAIVA